MIGEIVTERFAYVQGWSTDDPPQYQTVTQNEAERYFQWCIDQMRESGADVSPIERSMTPIKGAYDEKPFRMSYQQSVTVTGSEEVIEQLRQKFKGV